MLQTTAGKRTRQIAILREWLIAREDEKTDDTAYVSSFNYDRHITSFLLGNGLVGLHISSFDSMEKGSAQAAAGRDVFLLYDPKAGTARPGLMNLGVTKERVRAQGCFRAAATHFVLADINKDGLRDLGTVREQLRCKASDTEPGKAETVEGPIYQQGPIQWAVFRDDQWRYHETYDGVIPAQHTEFPLITISISPVDYVASLAWGTYDTAVWESEQSPLALFIPRYRRELMKKGALSSLKCNQGDIAEAACAEELIQNLPEVHALEKQISQHKGVSAIIFTEAEPEPNAQSGTEAAAYRIYFGESHETHTVRIFTFGVDAKTRAIFVYDDLQSERIPLAEWRQRKKPSP